MTPEQIALCTGANQARALLFTPHLNAAMEEFGITTPQQQAAFLAQVGHESGGLVWMREIWGPTPQQKKYEPPSDVADRLGNTQPGDGIRYLGRGPIQITGRYNYRAMGRILKLDLETHPDLLDSLLNACRSAAAFWWSHELNNLADAGDFEGITRCINGGLTGQADRLARWEVAKAALNLDSDEANERLA